MVDGRTVSSASNSSSTTPGRPPRSTAAPGTHRLQVQPHSIGARRPDDVARAAARGTRASCPLSSRRPAAIPRRRSARSTPTVSGFATRSRVRSSPGIRSARTSGSAATSSRRCGERLREMHVRGIAYVDLHKRENVIVGDDGRPYLVDFQISFDVTHPRLRWVPGARAVFDQLCVGDLYHLEKHVRRADPLASGSRRPRFRRGCRCIGSSLFPFASSGGGSSSPGESAPGGGRLPVKSSPRTPSAANPHKPRDNRTAHSVNFR